MDMQPQLLGPPTRACACAPPSPLFCISSMLLLLPPGVCIKLKELITRLFPRRSKQRRIEVDQEREREKGEQDGDTDQQEQA